MKQTKKFIVLQNKENGHFVAEYKQRGMRLSYEVGFTDLIQDALILEYEGYEIQKEMFDSLAEAFKSRVVIVEATHEIKLLDGSDAPEPKERNGRSELLDFLEALSK